MRRTNVYIVDTSVYRKIYKERTNLINAIKNQYGSRSFFNGATLQATGLGWEVDKRMPICEGALIEWLSLPLIGTT